MAVLLVCLGVTVALGPRVLIIPRLYERNLRSNLHLTAMDLPRAGEKVLVFAPHPDDEILGCGGYIQQAVSAGAEVYVVLMTNGEYPEIDLPHLEEKLRLEKDAFIKLGLMRQMESISALGYMGLPAGNVIFLGYPNRYLDDMWLPAHWPPHSPVRSSRTDTSYSPFANSMTGRAVFCGQSALDDVAKVLLRQRPEVVITLHPNDVHPDHWPAYGMVRFALNELAARGEEFAPWCRVYTYLIHRDSWPAPRAYRPTQELEPPASLALTGQTKWLGLPLTREQTQSKHKATGYYRTQAGRYDPLLRSFSRATELYGTIEQRTWPDEETIEPRIVIVDPEADLVMSAGDKRGDISTVWLGQSGGRILARVITRGPASSKIGYHLVLHAGGADASDRAVIQYDWQGGKASVSVFRDGRTRKNITGSTTSALNGNISTLSAPWPMEDGKQEFFLVRAWTTKGKRLADQTATGTYRISGRNR